MFGFQFATMHTSKDNVYGGNNNVIKFVYQTLVTTTQGLEWTLNIEKFNIIRGILPKNSQNIILPLNITMSIVNVIANDFQVNDELINVVLNHKIAFINLCDFSDEDGILPVFVHSFNSSLLILIYSIKILLTCCLKYTLFMFSLSCNALRQCLLPSMPPWS